MNLKKIINDWWMSPNWWVQGAHALLGATFVIFPMWLTDKISYSVFGTILLFVYGFWKEVFLDPWIEGNKFLWDGFEDMCFLYLGGIMPWLIKYLMIRWL